MGSVKDLKVMRKPTKTELGECIFEFSNRYSIFDWGEMPNHIPQKGAALCTMTAWNFEQLGKKGIPTHYIGVLDNSGNLTTTEELRKPSNKMVVKLSNVVKPSFEDGKFNYDFFGRKGKINNFVVPLEVIYRNGTPQGSSLFKKLERLKRESKNEELLKILSKYGLTEIPKPGDLFPQTGYDFTTKFEPSDRELTDREAYEISGLTEERFRELENIRSKIIDFVRGRTDEVGLVDFDGKLEFVLFNNVMLADVFGTFDENRFMLNGQQVSKELLRQHYIHGEGGWYEEVQRAKNEARERSIEDWRTLVKIQPQKLDPLLIKLIGEIYASGSDRYTGLNLFNVRPLEMVMEDLRQL